MSKGKVESSLIKDYKVAQFTQQLNQPEEIKNLRRQRKNNTRTNEEYASLNFDSSEEEKDEIIKELVISLLFQLPLSYFYSPPRPPNRILSTANLRIDGPLWFSPSRLLTLSHPSLTLSHPSLTLSAPHPPNLLIPFVLLPLKPVDPSHFTTKLGQ